METITSWFLAVALTISGFLGAPQVQEPTLGLSVLKANQGGTGVGTAAPSDVGKVLKVSSDSPFTYTLQDDQTGAGGSFPFTPFTSWNATSTLINFTAGVFSNASSTLHILRNTYASSTYASFSTASTSNLIVSGLNSASCDVKASSNGTLSCGTDATGSGGGSGNVATSSAETSGRVPFWTSTAGTPAQLSGGVADFAWDNTFKRLTATFASSTTFSATTIYGALVGNASTATALSANGANCAAGNAPLGIDTTGAVEGCFDVWTEAENTSAGYVVGTRALTVAGTANQITSSAGSQNLTADRTWTLSLPSHVIFPGSYVAGTGTTTNATSTQLNVVTHLRSEGTTRFDQLTSALLLTGSTGVAAEYTGASCTNQVIEDLDVLGAPTCRTITSAYVDSSVATFGYPFTTSALGFSTSTIGINTAGLISTASSSIAFLDSVRATSTSFISTNATTSYLKINTSLSFGGVAGDAWSDFCVSITGTSALCDGDDATGGGGGVWPFVTTALTYFTPTQSTSTPLWLRGSPYSLFASSTAVFDYASTSVLSADTIYPFTSGDVVITAPAGTIELNGADLQFFGSGSYKFWSGNGFVDAFFDATALATIDRTYTFPDASGTLTLGTGSTGNCAQWSATNVLTHSGAPCGSGGSTDTVLWANASTSPWSVLSLNANSSSSVAFLSMTRATSTDFFNTNATSSVISVSTHLRSAGSTRLDNMTSALLLTGSTGLVAEYTGANCTNQVIEDLDALGAPTCRTITSAYVDSTISTFGWPFTPATSWNATSTIIRNTTGFMGNASSSLAFLDVVIGTTTNATSTFAYVSSHFRAASIRNDAVTSAMVSATATGVLQATTVSSPLSFSGSTLSCATCATFGFPWTPATSWTATSTLMLNTGGWMSTASSTFSLLNTDNISISSSGSLVLPTSVDPIVNAAGKFALDTTSGNLIFATSTAQELVAASATTTLYALVIASTSPDFASGGIIPLPTHFLKQQAVGIICEVDGGTSQQIFLSDAASTNDTNTITCSTTETQYNFTTNNIWNAYEPIQLEFGTKSGAPDYVTIRIVGFRTSD